MPAVEAEFHPEQRNPGGSLRPVIQRHLADDPGHEVAQLFIIGSLFAVLRFQQTVVYDFVAGRIGWSAFSFRFGQYHSPLQKSKRGYSS